MARFVYQAIDRKGKRHRGKIEASNYERAISQLKEKELFVVELKPQQPALRLLEMEVHFGKPVKPQEFATFARQLATLIRAGVPIMNSIQALSEQTVNKTFKRTLLAIAEELRKGNQLSAALSGHPKIFPAVFVNMCRAGEMAGNLDDVLDRLALFFEKEYYTRQKVKSALTYPVMVTILSVIITIFLLTTVIPSFVTMFKTFNAPLPLPTKIVLTLSDFFVNKWYVALSVFVVLILGYILFSRSKRGRYIIDYVKLKMPIFGMLFRKAAIARMARTLGSMFSSAVPVLQALNITAEIVGNRVIGQALHEASDSLRQGQGLSEPMKRNWVFPPVVVQMVSVGEETGSLDVMLNKVADFYESDVEIMVDQLKSMIEPILILVLASIIGTIVTSVILPMFEIMNYVH
jgi:type IV pilus assembly protein PilC